MAFLPEQKQALDDLMRKHPDETAELVREIIRTHPQAVKDAMKRVDVFHVVAKSTIGAVRHNKVNSVLKNHNVAAFTGEAAKSPTSSPSQFKRALVGTGRRGSIPDNAPSKIVIPGMQREAPKISSLMANFGQSKNNKFDKLMNRWNDQNTDAKADAEKKVAPPKKLVVSEKFRRGSVASSSSDSQHKEPRASPKARKGFVKMATLELEGRTSATESASTPPAAKPRSPIRKSTTRELVKAMSFGLLGKTDEEKALEAAKKDAKAEERMDEEFIKILPRAGSKTKVEEVEVEVEATEPNKTVAEDETAAAVVPDSTPVVEVDQENAAEQQPTDSSSETQTTPATEQAVEVKSVDDSSSAALKEESTATPVEDASTAVPVEEPKPAATVASEEQTKEEPVSAEAVTVSETPADGKKKRRERRERKSGGLASKWAKKAEEGA